ncbi:MAG: killer suppression protein HigA [Spirochaetota bacterium]
MIVEYLDSEIRSICLEAKKASKRLGAESARKLQVRLADLRAARNVTELITGRPHPHKGPNEKRFSLDLAGGARILFVPTEDPPPRKKDGGIDWVMVAEVTIVFIGDNHDE